MQRVLGNLHSLAHDHPVDPAGLEPKPGNRRDLYRELRPEPDQHLDCALNGRPRKHLRDPGHRHATE